MTLWQASGWLWAGLAIVIVFWVGVTLLVMRALGKPARAALAGGGDSAPDAAMARYARGEITLEQYEQLRRDLGQG